MSVTEYNGIKVGDKVRVTVTGYWDSGMEEWLKCTDEEAVGLPVHLLKGKVYIVTKFIDVKKKGLRATLSPGDLIVMGSVPLDWFVPYTDVKVDRFEAVLGEL